MTEPQNDDPRLVYGVACTCEMFFQVGALEASTYGHASGRPGDVVLHLQITPDPDIRLEGSPDSLAQMPGQLTLISGRERAERVGYIHRMRPDRYEAVLFLFKEEVDHTLRLLAAGLRPRRLRLESDSEFHQWVDSENYWDDVRYPLVELTEFSLRWGPADDGAGTSPVPTPGQG